MFLFIDASLILWICAGWVLLLGIALAFFVPLCMVAKRADLREELATELDPALDRLTEVHSPSGTPFFADPAARDELADELLELVVLAH